MRKENIWWRFAALGFLSLVFLILDQIKLISPIRQIVEVPVVAAKQEVYSLGRGLLFLSAWRIKDSEVAVLRSEVSRLSSISAQVAILSQENQALRVQMGLVEVVPRRLVMARPVGFVGGRLTIDVGASEGVAVGNTVVVGQSLVGRVTLVSRSQSQVQVPMFEGEKIAVAVRKTTDGARKASGVVMGLGGQLILDRVVLAEPVEKGDLVMTLGEGYERDLVVGTVGEVLERDNQLFKKAQVTPAVDYFRLEKVFVVLAE